MVTRTRTRTAASGPGRVRARVFVVGAAFKIQRCVVLFMPPVASPLRRRCTTRRGGQCCRWMEYHYIIIMCSKNDDVPESPNSEHCSEARGTNFITLLLVMTSVLTETDREKKGVGRKPPRARREENQDFPPSCLLLAASCVTPGRQRQLPSRAGRGEGGGRERGQGSDHPWTEHDA